MTAGKNGARVASANIARRRAAQASVDRGNTVSTRWM